MTAAIILAASLGKWRYFITGSALVLLFGMLIRVCRRVLSPLGERLVFSGKVIEMQSQDGKNAVVASFSDGRRIRHTAAFLSDEPAEIGAEIRFAIRAELFAAGEYPQQLADADKAGSNIVSYRAYKTMLRRQITKELLIGLMLCGIALCLVILAMKLCFPA